MRYIRVARRAERAGHEPLGGQPGPVQRSRGPGPRRPRTARRPRRAGPGASHWSSTNARVLTIGRPMARRGRPRPAARSGRGADRGLGRAVPVDQAAARRPPVDQVLAERLARGASAPATEVSAAGSVSLDSSSRRNGGVADHRSARGPPGPGRPRRPVHPAWPARPGPRRCPGPDQISRPGASKPGEANCSTRAARAGPNGAACAARRRQAGVGDDDALGGAGGAGGVDHVGRVPRAQPVPCRSCVVTLVRVSGPRTWVAGTCSSRVSTGTVTSGKSGPWPRW